MHFSAAIRDRNRDSAEAQPIGASVKGMERQRFKERRGPESNRRIAVLQTAALPLGYRARNSP